MNYRRVMPWLGVLLVGGLLYGLTTSRNPTCSTCTPTTTNREDTKGRRHTMSTAASVTASDFTEQVLPGSTPVLVDFWAPWCGPCRMLGPVVEEIAADYKGKVKVVKVNIDENQALASKYDVRSIPTLIIFKEGQPVERMVGALPKSEIAKKIDSHIGGAK
jgi:thioredoxin 1